jgi:hypothetical protein
MRNRKVYLVEDEVLDASGTRIFNLDFSNPLVALIITIEGKKYDMSDTHNPIIAREISKIEIVDGSDVLFSMNMEEAQALQLYTFGGMPFLNYSNNSISGRCRATAKIAFGRDDSDNEWMLDCTRFVNPQLKVTYAFTEGAGYWTDNYQKLTVWALVCESPVTAALGFLMGKQVYTWAKATSGDETIDMPRDFPYRFMMVRVKDSDTPTYAEISKIKLSCDIDRFVPVNITTQDLYFENVGKYGMLRCQMETIGDGSDTDIKAHSPFANNWGGSIQCWNSGDVAVIKRPYSGYSTIGKDTTTALDASQRAIVTHMGHEFHFCEPLPFGNLRDAGEFFDPTPFQAVRLILTQGQTDACSSAVVLQQVRPY